MSNPIVNWLRSDVRTRDDRFDGGLGRAEVPRPPLEEVYAVYLMLYAPVRPSSMAMGPLADFVEVLRQHGKTAAYSDEEWTQFFMRFTGGDADRARDLWDGLVCQ